MNHVFELLLWRGQPTHRELQRRQMEQEIMGEQERRRGKEEGKDPDAAPGEERENEGDMETSDQLPIGRKRKRLSIQNDGRDDVTDAKDGNVRCWGEIFEAVLPGRLDWKMKSSAVGKEGKTEDGKKGKIGTEERIPPEPLKNQEGNSKKKR